MSAPPRIIVLARDHAQAKTRLAPCLDPVDRAALARAMLNDLLETLEAARSGWEITVATDSRSIGEQVMRVGARPTHLPAEGPRAAAAEALAAARRDHCPAALVIPADLPLAQPEDILAVIAAGERRAQMVVVPDRHEDGTNALLLRPPDRLPPLFGVGSYAAHLAAARAARVSVCVITPASLVFDLDTVDDLALLRSRAVSAAPRTRELLAVLNERNVRTRAPRYSGQA